MGLRFRRRIKLFPGVAINIGKTGVTSCSIGGKGLTVNVSKKGTRATVGIPGTGISYSEKLSEPAFSKISKENNNTDADDLDSFVFVNRDTSSEVEPKYILFLLIFIAIIAYLLIKI